MKLVYSKNVNLLHCELGTILYPEIDRTINEIIEFVNKHVTDNSVVVSLNETVIKQIYKLVKKGVLSSTLEFESNLPLYKDTGLTCKRFLEIFVDHTKYLYNNE